MGDVVGAYPLLVAAGLFYLIAGVVARGMIKAEKVGSPTAVEAVA